MKNLGHLRPDNFLGKLTYKAQYQKQTQTTSRELLSIMQTDLI